MSGIMTAYVMNYWPCARYVDNVAKVVNEMTFIAVLVNCVYLKEMAASVSNFNPSASPAQAGQGAGNFMIFLTSALMVFHAARLIHNAIQAARTIKMRRQQIASKWMGPPTHNDPDHSNDTSSGTEEEQDAFDPDDSPSMDKLQLPKNEPAEGKKLDGLEIQLPMEILDALMAMPRVLKEANLIPKPEPEDSSEEEVEIDVKSALDIDL